MKVSIITAYYKGREYLDDYIKMIRRNVKNMSEEDSLEVILVNDCPEDKLTMSDIPSTSKGVDASGLTIRILTNKENMGIHASRERGLKASTGDYVIFLDQDDLLSKSAVKTFIMNAETGGDVLVSNALLEQAPGSEHRYLKWYRSDYHTKMIGDINCYLDVGIQIISPGQCLIRKGAIPIAWTEYICKKNGADDYFLWLLMLSLGAEFKYINKPLYLHKYTGDNLSADTTVTDDSTIEFAEYLKEIEYFPNEYVRRLRSMVEYKARFREDDSVGKIIDSFYNYDILKANIEYKIRTRTPLGFNR